MPHDGRSNICPSHPKLKTVKAADKPPSSCSSLYLFATCSLYQTPSILVPTTILNHFLELTIIASRQAPSNATTPATMVNTTAVKEARAARYPTQPWDSQLLQWASIYWNLISLFIMIHSIIAPRKHPRSNSVRSHGAHSNVAHSDCALSGGALRCSCCSNVAVRLVPYCNSCHNADDSSSDNLRDTLATAITRLPPVLDMADVLDPDNDICDDGEEFCENVEETSSWRDEEDLTQVPGSGCYWPRLRKCDHLRGKCVERRKNL